jgi:multiple antibiotic resistance protein
MIIELLDYFLIAFTALFVIVNPITTAFIFQSLIPFGNHNLKKAVAFKASLVALSILLIFSLFGNFIFYVFGITIHAFKIAGGLILFGISMKMIKHHEGEHDEKHHMSTEMDSDDVAIIPLAIPFMSGPGSIATSILLTSQAQTKLHFLIVLVSIVIIMIICYFAMIYSKYITDVIGNTGKKIATKIFGLILAIISVQFVINGLIDLVPIIIQTALN